MDTNINGFNSLASAPKKRVLFIITQSESGGAQQFILQFAKRLEKTTHDIAVAVGSDGDNSLVHTLMEIGIPVCALPALKRNINPIYDLLAARQIKKLIRSFQPDTLFLNSSKAGFVGAWAALSSNHKLRVIYRIGGWSFNDPGSMFKKQMSIVLEKISANWKDVIIVNNNHDLEQAKRIGITPREELIMIHNGLDPYSLDFIPKEVARKELNLPQSKKIVGTIANFYPAKGLEYLIESAKITNRDDTIWCIIGDGRGRFELEKQIEKNNLLDKIILLGKKETASKYLKAFDVFILPSVKEGFPWSILEAMSAKLPVIATNVGAVPEIIEDGLNGYIVEPRNPQEISERVHTLLDSSSVAQEMGIQAHQRILFAFSIDKTIHQIEKLL